MSNGSSNQSWVVPVVIAIIGATGVIVAAIINKLPTDKSPETTGSDQNSLPSSVSSESSPTQPVKTPSEIPSLEWNDSARSLKISNRLDQDFSFMCSPGGSIERIYGTSIYTSDSSICTAAVHSGLINAKDGGQVTIQIQGIQDSYQGTKGNGVESGNHGKHSQSFTFIK